MARRGRRPKGEYPEKKRVFASRIREDTWEMLQSHEEPEAGNLHIRVCRRQSPGEASVRNSSSDFDGASMMTRKLKARSGT
jgi:hypothetical protein